MSKRKISALLMALTLLLAVTACRRRPAPPPPPPPPTVTEAPKPPEPAKPAINSFTAEPSTIDRGQSATLRWAVSNATDITINQGIGAVPASGSRQVFPSNTTTYELTATGPGGSAKSSATVTVNVPPPPPPPKPKPTVTFRQRIESEIQDAYFDYDRSDIRSDAQTVLTRNAETLKSVFGAFPAETVVIEGHCDERGSSEYNLGLGDRRATSAKEFLVQLGVPADRLRTISYGKERPQCTEQNEDCWQRNRRVHFAAQ